MKKQRGDTKWPDGRGGSARTHVVVLALGAEHRDVAGVSDLRVSLAKVLLRIQRIEPVRNEIAMALSEGCNPDASNERVG